MLWSATSSAIQTTSTTATTAATTATTAATTFQRRQRRQQFPVVPPDDCNIKMDDDGSECWGSWDCAGFTDIASSCLADCDASQANDFALHSCVLPLTATLCYTEGWPRTCACDELNVGDDSITGYSLPSDAVNLARRTGAGARAWTTAAWTTIEFDAPRPLLGPLRAQVPR